MKKTKLKNWKLHFKKKNLKNSQQSKSYLAVEKQENASQRRLKPTKTYLQYNDYETFSTECTSSYPMLHSHRHLYVIV